jgi:predicted naringenin-chalcone synthase
MSLTILGLGTALPPFEMTQAEAAELARQVNLPTDEQATLLKVLYRRAGVKTRYTVVPYQTVLEWVQAAADMSAAQGGVTEHVVTRGATTQERMTIYAREAPKLALRAAAEALERSELSGREITHLVTVSCTGFEAPGVDVELIARLGLPPTVQRTHVGFMGCHGAINGLRVARGLALADAPANVLVSATELCSLHYFLPWESSRFVGNAIFSDGSAALVGTASPLEGEWQVAACGSCVIPDSRDAMSWTVGDFGFEMDLSPRVPELIRKHLRPWLEQWLNANGVALADVGSWAVHPGGPRILTAVEESLGLAPQATAVSREVLSECGNMSSPTVLFILDRLRRRDAPRPCVLLGFGPGLVAEAALIKG